MNYANLRSNVIDQDRPGISNWYGLYSPIMQVNHFIQQVENGGIGPDDAERIKAFSHPLFAGVDLNSRFETEPAVKDVQLIDSFIKQLRG